MNFFSYTPIVTEDKDNVDNTDKTDVALAVNNPLQSRSRSRSQSQPEIPECLFCTTRENIYKSTACECKSAYFCKECITHNQLMEGQNHAKDCPNCRTPLKLEMSGPKRVCCISINAIVPLYNRIIKCCVDTSLYCRNITEWTYSPDVHIMRGTLLSLVLYIIIFMTYTDKQHKQSMHTLIYFVNIGIFLMYFIMFQLNKKIEYETYFGIVHKNYPTTTTPNPYYSFLSPYTFVKITEENISRVFWTGVYIPLILTITSTVYLQSYCGKEHLSPWSVLAVLLPNSIIIISCIKYFASIFVAYVVSGVYKIVDSTLVMKGNYVHMNTFLMLIFTTYLGIIAIYDSTGIDKLVMAFLVIACVALNFVLSIEMCRFFKYDHEDKADTNDSPSDVSFCKRGNFTCANYNIENASYEEYYFGELNTNMTQFSWYFGKGYAGRVRIFFTCALVPFIFQTVGLLMLIMYDRKDVYFTMVGASYVGWCAQTILKSIAYMLYVAWKWFISQCFLFWTVEITPTVKNTNLQEV